MSVNSMEVRVANRGYHHSNGIRVLVLRPVVGNPDTIEIRIEDMSGAGKLGARFSLVVDRNELLNGISLVESANFDD